MTATCLCKVVCVQEPMQASMTSSNGMSVSDHIGKGTVINVHMIYGSVCVSDRIHIIISVGVYFHFRISSITNKGSSAADNQY